MRIILRNTLRNVDFVGFADDEFEASGEFGSEMEPNSEPELGLALALEVECPVVEG